MPVPRTMIGWVAPTTADWGKGLAHSRFHSSPFCHGELVPVLIIDGCFRPRHSHRMVALQWCRHCGAPDMAPGEWAERAACRGVDQQVFFAEDHEGSGQYDQAKAICRACPVLGVCLAYVRKTHPRYGFWAGYSPLDRRTGRMRPCVATGGTSAGVSRYGRRDAALSVADPTKATPSSPTATGQR